MEASLTQIKINGDKGNRRGEMRPGRKSEDRKKERKGKNSNDSNDSKDFNDLKPVRSMVHPKMLIAPPSNIMNQATALVSNTSNSINIIPTNQITNPHTEPNVPTVMGPNTVARTFREGM